MRSSCTIIDVLWAGQVKNIEMERSKNISIREKGSKAEQGADNENALES